MAVEGEQRTCYTIPIGPTHPSLKEPLQFSFDLEGERVVDVEIKPGWTHRGVEVLGMKRNPLQTLYLAERICGICSVSHLISFSRAVENALGIPVPPRAEYIRVIIAELERIHSHILWAGVAAHELGFDTLLHLTWRVREQVMDILELLTGNRVNYALVTIGGVRRDITKEQEPLVRQALRYYKDLFEMLVDAFLHDPTIELRTRDVGVLSYKDALELMAVGPTARASGVKKDIRVDQPYLAYPALEISPITPDLFRPEIHGDVYDKIIVRLLEVEQSIGLIEQALEKMPEGEIGHATKEEMTELLVQIKEREGEGIGRHEAPRGELFHYIRFQADNEIPILWKVKCPTYSNLMSYRPMFQGAQIADIPIIIACIDPCIACMDRVIIRRDGEEEVWTAEQLLAKSWEKTRRLKG
ncbi:MAG: hydrogenase large subunit [Candidatus Bipolaricaulia bacterium]